MPDYTLEFPGPSGFLNGIDSSGQAVGATFVTNGQFPQSTPARWPAPYGGDVVELAAGSLLSQFFRANSNGYAVGFFGGTNVIAYKFEPGSGPDLPVIAPTTIPGLVTDINDNNQILLADGSIYQIEPDNTATLNPVLIPAGATCRGMNNNGYVVGNLADGTPFLFSPVEVNYLPGNCSLYDINDNLLAVGYSAGLPVYIDLSQPMAEWNQTPIPLPASPEAVNGGDGETWMAVNNSGTIVGNVTVAGTGMQSGYPFVYYGPTKKGAAPASPGSALNLNGQVLGSGAPYLLNARDINDSGVIVGNCALDTFTGYVATPFPGAIRIDWPLTKMLETIRLWMAYEKAGVARTEALIERLAKTIDIN